MGDYTGENPPWGVSRQSHILGSEVWQREDKSPWLVGGPRGSLNSACGEHERLFAPEAGQRGWIEIKRVSDWFPETRQVPSIAWAKQTLQHQSGNCHDQGTSLAVRSCGSSNPKQHLGQEGAAIPGYSTGGASEAVWISDGGQTATACALALAEYPHQPLLLQHCSPLGQACWCWEEEEHTLKGKRVSSDSTPRASAPAIWDSTLSQIGWWWSLNRREALPYTWLHP